MKPREFQRILEQPDEQLRSYNARDCEETFEAAYHLANDMRLLNAQKTHDIMLRCAMPAYKIQEYGIVVDKERRAALLAGIKEKMAERVTIMLNTFDEVCGGELAAATAIGGVLRRLTNPKRKATLKNKEFNPRSKAHLTLLLKRMGMKWPQTTPSGQPQLNLDVIMKLRRQKPDNAILLTALWEYAKLEKARADWLEDGKDSHLLCKDGLLRASVRVCGTQSGRFSETVREWCATCQDTNHGRNRQNMPKNTDGFMLEHAPIRTMMVARPGRIIVERDYSALEAWIAARISGDNVFLEKLESGRIHYKNAADLFAIPEEEVTEQQKRLAKVFIYGGVLYLGGPNTIQNSFEKEGFLIPLAKVKVWQNRWQVAHWRYIRWQRNLIMEAQRRSPMAVFTALGRRRNFIGEPRTWERDATAHVISGTGADHTNLALIELSEKGYDVLLHGHDSLALEVDDNDASIAQAIEDSRIAFETDRGFGVLLSEVKVGRSLGELHEWQPSSH
jgi:DNA polymerase I-like protein with 3'-5' exonuclease and polymerase domains